MQFDDALHAVRKEQDVHWCAQHSQQVIASLLFKGLSPMLSSTSGLRERSVQLYFTQDTMNRIGKREERNKPSQGKRKGRPKHICPQFVCSYNTRPQAGHEQICLCLQRLPAEMFPDHGFLTWRLVGILCRLLVIATLVRVTLTLTAAAQTSRWRKHVNRGRQILMLPHIPACVFNCF